MLDEEGLHNTFLISLTGPEQLSSHILPKHIKFLVREKWNRFMDRNLKEEHSNFKRYINDCLDYMDSEDLYESKKREFEKGYGLLNLLSNKKVNLAKSNSEARRFVKSKAIKLNNNLITDEKYLVQIDNFTNNDELQISLGKKITIIIKLD